MDIREDYSNPEYSETLVSTPAESVLPTEAYKTRLALLEDSM